MNEFILSCCSSVDLPAEHLRSRDIHYICPHFFLDDKEYPDDMGESISSEDFYKAMEQGAMTKTTQVNISEYLDYFTPFLEAGKDVLHLTLSSGISGTYNSACNAAAIARERYPERKIYIVDSLGASSGYGLLMDAVADKRDEGLDIDALYAWAEENRLRINHWFFSTDLTFFVRGGRISKAAGVFGGMLNICPLMNVDYMGRLIPREKVRTKKKVIQAIVDKMIQCADDGTDYSGKCYISMSACREDAEEVAQLVEEHFPKLNGTVVINNIGGLIGSHTGPGTVALFFWGKKRED